MSELLTGEFDVYSAPGMHEAILELTEKYGVERAEAEHGVQLAERVHALLYDMEPQKALHRRATERAVKKLFKEAAATTPGIPVDQLGVPLPRYRYVAADILGLVLTGNDPFYSYFDAVRNAPMIPNFAKTKEVIDILVPLLQNNEFPYNQDRFMLPEDPYNMPKTLFKNEIEEANFYLTSCLWMRRTDSNKAMRDLGKAFDDTRGNAVDPFDPLAVAAMSPEQVAATFGRYPQLRMLESNSPGLIHNMEFLLARFDGDIRNAYAGTKDFDEVVLRLKNDKHQDNPSRVLPEFGNGMYGFAEKMVSMLTYYLTEAGLIEPIDYPAPIDQHLAKLTTGNGCVRIVGDFKDENILTAYLQKVARDLYYDISLTHNINSNDIAKALWLLGSKFCSQSPATFTQVITRDGRNSTFAPYEPKYGTNGFDTAAMYATCLSCPLHHANHCTHIARGKENHLKGKLVLVDRRDLPNPADHAVFGGDPEWERVAAESAAAARDAADRERRLTRRPAYEAGKSPQQVPPAQSELQDGLFDL